MQRPPQKKPISPVESLKLEIAQCPRRADGCRRYSDALKAKDVDYAVVALETPGASLKSVSATLEMSDSVPHSWLRPRPRRKAPRKNAQVIPVSVTKAIPKFFQLKGPGGFVVDGLTASYLADILAAVDAR